MSLQDKTVSFEFFPVRTIEGRAKQIHVRQQLRELSPTFFSCTSGAGGSTREGTLQMVRDILAEQTPVAPHLPCIGMNEEEIKTLLDEYYALGVRRLVALRGDIPSGMGYGMMGFHYANELVEFIKNQYDDKFHIVVAAYPEYHPQAASASDDINNFVRKVKAGANSAITQYFFNTDAYFRFVDDVQAQGVDIPIIPGIMPIENFTKLARFSNLCGAEIPRWLRLKLYSYADDTASIRALALDVVGEMCERLLDGGATGLHFYTMNNAELSTALCHRLQQR